MKMRIVVTIEYSLYQILQNENVRGHNLFHKNEMKLVVMYQHILYFRYYKMNMIAVVSFIVSYITDVIKIKRPFISNLMPSIEINLQNNR